MLKIIYILSILCSYKHTNHLKLCKHKENTNNKNFLSRKKRFISMGNFSIKKENLSIYLCRLDYILNVLLTNNKIRGDFCNIVGKIFFNMINEKRINEINDSTEYLISLMNSFTSNIENLCLFSNKHNLGESVESYFKFKNENKIYNTNLNSMFINKNFCSEMIQSDLHYQQFYFNKTGKHFSTLSNLFFYLNQYSYNFVSEILSIINFLKNFKNDFNNRSIFFNNVSNSIDVNIQFGFSRLYALAKDNINNKNHDILKENTLISDSLNYESIQIVYNDMLDEIQYVEDSFNKKLPYIYSFINNCIIQNEQYVMSFFFSTIIDILTNLKYSILNKNINVYVNLFNKKNTNFKDFDFFSRNKDYLFLYELFKDVMIEQFKDDKITVYYLKMKQTYDIRVSIINFLVNYIINKCLTKFYL